MALPGRSDAEELQKENNKNTKALKGQAVFSVAKVRTQMAGCTASGAYVHGGSAGSEPAIYRWVVVVGERRGVISDLSW